MRWQDQGTTGSGRYAVIPRVLAFLTYGGEVLLLRGAANKRIWAGKLNGVGGHVEPGEDPLAAARREIHEETGIAAEELDLRAVVHVSGRAPEPGVIFFVYVGRARSRETARGGEGALEWWPIDALPQGDMVEDLPLLLPRVLTPTPGALTYGHYLADESGEMRFAFRQG